MKKILTLTFIFIFFISGVKANSVLSGFKSTFEKLPLPFHIVKETAEKVSSFGLKKLIFGLTSAAMISEYYSDLKNSKKENADNPIQYDKKFRKIISEGQIHINGIDTNEAQRRALEDALYFAAVKAGVKVHGYSTINQDTSITENFTVKPDSRILDYKIIKSFEENKIYKVVIEAVVGNPNMNYQNCNKRRIINLVEYKGPKTLNTNLSPDKDKNLALISNLISNNLELDNFINHVNNKSQYFDFNEAGFDKNYDYTTLVNGEYDLKNGDYILIPSIKMYKTKIYPNTFLIKDGQFPKIKNLNFLDADALGFHINVKIYNSMDKGLVENIDEKYLIPLNIDSNFETIELFTKIDKEFLALELENISLDIVNIVKNKLTCKPVTARLEFYNNKLYVKMGQNNGLRMNQLAILENSDQNNNWTMFSVNQVSANEAELKPLNKKINLELLAGKKTRFLE